MSIKLAARLTVYCALALALTLLCEAQQSTPPASADAPSQSQPPDSAAAKPAPSVPQTAGGDKDSKDKDKNGDPSGQGKVAGTSNDRLFYALPNFLTLQGREKLPPLSTKDKFKVVALGTFDYFEYPWWGAISAIGQAANSEPAFRQGWVGYAKRYGTTAGDSMVENFMVGAVYPSILRQDPRFYQSGKGGFFTRSGYAISRIFVTRSDSGRTQFNFSEILGASTAAAISTYSYHPRSTFVSTPTNPHLFIPSDRTFSNTVSVFGTQVALDTVTIFVKEFWPDIHRKMSHKKEAAQPTAALATPAP